MPKKKCKCPEGIPEWVVTFGDLMSLLLCFFVLIVAFSEPKKPKEFREVLEAIQEALGFEGGLGQAAIIDTPTNATVAILEEQAKRDDNKRSTDVQNEKNVAGRETTVSVVHDGGRHTKGGTLPFSPGESALTTTLKDQLLNSVAPQIRGRRNIVRIVGHAWGYEDRIAGQVGEGTANGIMAMSYRRAQEVHDFLVNEAGINPQILRIELAGDREPAEIPTYAADGGAVNRRVQVYLTDRTVDDVHPDPLGTGRSR